MIVLWLLDGASLARGIGQSLAAGSLDWAELAGRDLADGLVSWAVSCCSVCVGRRRRGVERTVAARGRTALLARAEGVTMDADHGRRAAAGRRTGAIAARSGGGTGSGY
ncbi:hypothetical protein ACLOJK_014986 [Asimina triloba]